MAGRNLPRRLDEGQRDAKVVVAILQFSGFRVEASPIRVAALRDDHALGARFRHVEIVE